MHSALRSVSIKIGFCVFLCKRKTADIGISNRASYYFLSLMAAWAGVDNQRKYIILQENDTTYIRMGCPSRKYGVWICLHSFPYVI